MWWQVLIRNPRWEVHWSGDSETQVVQLPKLLFLNARQFFASEKTQIREWGGRNGWRQSDNLSCKFARLPFSSSLLRTKNFSSSSSLLFWCWKTSGGLTLFAISEKLFLNIFVSRCTISFCVSLWALIDASAGVRTRREESQNVRYNDTARTSYLFLCARAMLE